jgi:hypothetical protein
MTSAAFNNDETNCPYRQYANAYLEKGMSPLPVKPGSRGAQIKGWQAYSSNLPSQDMVESWVSKSENAGISLVMGTELIGASGQYLIAIDVDQDELVEPAKIIVLGDERNHGAVYVAKFGSKGISFFARTERMLPSRSFDNGDGMGIEILSEKRQCVIPPSVHHTGSTYEWRSEETLLDVELTRLPLVDEEMMARLQHLVVDQPASEDPSGENELRGERKEYPMGGVDAAMARRFLRARGQFQETTSNDNSDPVTIEYQGGGEFQGVAMIYPGNVHHSEVTMAAKAAYWNHAFSESNPEERETAIQSIVEHALTANEASGRNENWDVEREQRDVAKMYDGAVEKYRAEWPVPDNSGANENAKTRLLSIMEEAELWHTRNKEPYATVRVHDHFENLRVQSNGFREWLSKLYYHRHKDSVGNYVVEEIVGVATAKARYVGEYRDVSLRLGGHEGFVYLDLGAPDWSAAKVTPNGWTIETRPSIAFRRSSGMEPLPTPAQGGDIQSLRRFMNLASEDDFVLIVAWLIGSLNPSGPYPVLVLNGEQGTGKSTLARLLRRLIDPSRAETRTAPRQEDDLFIAADNAWMLNFDNLSKIDARLSDALCRISAGGGIGKRRLYSDTDEIILEMARPVVVNGIPDLATRPDLADRTICIQLPRIDPDDRRPESQYWSDFNDAVSGILGALLDAVSSALANYETVRLEEYPRMADFSRWVVAALSATELDSGQFLAAFETNKNRANMALVESDPTAIAISQVVDAHDGSWSGTATELLRQFSNFVHEEYLHRYLPKVPVAVGNKVRRLAPAMSAIGIHVDFDREGASGRRMIHFTKIE